MNAMNPQARDLIRGMRRTKSETECCDLCGREMGDNRYSPFATVCKGCTDEIESDERDAR